MKRLDSISREQALDILNKVSIFDIFCSDEKNALTRFHSHFYHVSKGATLIQEGAIDDSFYILLAGKVSVSKKSAARPIVNLTPGDCFGEISFLTEQKRTTTVKAISNSIVFEVDRATLTSLDITIRERLKDTLISVLTRRLDHMNTLVAKLSQRLPLDA